MILTEREAQYNQKKKKKKNKQKKNLGPIVASGGWLVFKYTGVSLSIR